MQAQAPSHAPQKMAYLHFGSRFPFPLNPIFFGQTFVMGNLTACTRHVQDRRNYVFIREGLDPLSEPLMGEKARELAKSRFNAEIRVGYGTERVAEAASLAKSLADEGFHSAFVFHFPVSPDTQYAYALRGALGAAGLLGRSSIHFYLHTNADNHYHRPSEGRFASFHAAMARASDSIIGVSQAVRDNFVKIRVRDDGEEIGLDPARSFVVRNGIDPYIYVIRDERGLAEARRDLGLAEGLGKVVSFVGRMDSLKGSDYLIKVLEHFEASRDPKDADVGFVIATSHVLNVAQASKPFRGLLRMQRLIREDRLKVVLDISKYTRGDPRFRDDVSGLLRQFAFSHGLAGALEDPLFARMFGGMTNTPVQTVSDVYLHPARSEAFGLAVLEAVFGGAYVISTPVGGIPEIVVDERLGRLVPLESDKKTFVEKLIVEICGAKKPESYDRAWLGEYYRSYTEKAMFEGFEKAVLGGIVE